MINAAAAEHRPRAAVIDRHVAGEHADAGGPLHEDRVGGEQRVVFLDDRRKLVEEGLALRQPAGGQVGGEAADRDVAVGEAGAAGLLEEVEDLLPLAERVEEGTEAAEIEAVGPHPHEVAGDPAELRDQDAEMAGLLAHLIFHELLDGQRPAEVHVHRGEVVHPVGVGNKLPVGDVLADLLGAAVQIADVGLDLRDDLPVGPQHEPQNAVRGGMLRPHVDEHLVGADVELDNPGIVADHARHAHLPRMPWYSTGCS